jgi:hypothetical protein
MELDTNGNPMLGKTTAGEGAAFMLIGRNLDSNCVMLA